MSSYRPTATTDLVHIVTPDLSGVILDIALIEGEGIDDAINDLDSQFDVMGDYIGRSTNGHYEIRFIGPHINVHALAMAYDNGGV